MTEIKKPSLTTSPSTELPKTHVPPPSKTSAPPAVEDTFSPPLRKASPASSQTNSHQNYNTELALLESQGYQPHALRSENLITDFFLAKAKILDEPGFNLKRLSHKVKLKLGSGKEEQKLKFINAAKAGNISDNFPTICSEHAVFTVNNAELTRREIKLTIAIVERMESVIIRALTRELNRPPLQGRKSVGKVSRVIPGPDGKKKAIRLRRAENSEQSVKDRFLESSYRNSLLQLARQLPAPRQTSVVNKASFKRDAIALFSRKSPISLHELRRFLPIKETGSLKGHSAKIKLEGQTSIEVTKHGQRIGAIPLDD